MLGVKGFRRATACGRNLCLHRAALRHLLQHMKAISLNVSEVSYRKRKQVAEKRGLPVVELIRRAMDDFLERHCKERRPVRALPAFKTGPILKTWKGADFFEEMSRR